MAAVVLTGVRKRYARIDAIKGIDLACAGGDLTVVLGHSGAGKTSLLRMVAGLDTVDAGEIAVNGQVVTDLAPRDRDVSMAFESYALHPQMTVFDNVAFSLRISPATTRPTATDVEHRVKEMAELLEIGELLHRLPRQLSGGQRQRVALARALVRDASAHLLDEPIAHLDAKLRHHLRGALKHLQRRRGMTTIWTTPDQLEAMSIADRIALLHQGAVEQVGSVEELYQRPKNEFVARSLGDPPMNLLPASVRTTMDSWSLAVGSAVLPFSPADSGRLAVVPTGAVRVGIRPNHIRISSAPPPRGGVEAEVLIYEPLGQHSVSTVKALGRELKVKAAPEVDYRPGMRAWLTFDPAHYHLFHPDTGEAL